MGRASRSLDGFCRIFFLLYLVKKKIRKRKGKRIRKGKSSKKGGEMLYLNTKERMGVFIDWFACLLHLFIYL